MIRKEVNRTFLKQRSPLLINLTTMNPVAYISREIQTYFVGDHVEVSTLDMHKTQTLIRFHGLKTKGDVSFSTNSTVWENYFGNGVSKIFPKGEENLENIIKSLEDQGKKWRFPIERVEHLKGYERLAIYFQREATIIEMLRIVLHCKGQMVSYGHVPKNPLRRIHVLASRSDENNLTYYRAALIRNVLVNVLKYSEWIVENQAVEGDDGVLQVEVLSVAKTNCEQIDSKNITVFCGIVVDPKTAKLANYSTNEYISLRTNDLNLMALHKYGIRAKDDILFRELMNSLGAAAVTVDLIEKKCSSPSSIIRNGQGSNTKGACFILYNSARLETLLKTFDERIRAGQYGELPQLEEVNFSLLNNDEEWQLIFGYICAFPDLMERCVRQIESGQFASHMIVQFLSGLAATFSVYYRRVRILTEYRPHLMAQLYARIYLLKALRDVLNKALALLDIEPVAHM